MTTSDPHAVTIDQVVRIMREFGITLSVSTEPDSPAPVASANLNGYPVIFALLDSVLIVRADHETTTAVSEGDPRWHLACNQVNCFNFAAKAVAMDRGEKVIVRAEKDIPVAAGLTDTQLSMALKVAIDHVLGVQKAVEEAGTQLGQGV
ncbi:YbjN domain-containing protein [Corynebacterium pacaense]|uniref:YbjN domain-containing protein n=1 Tax=Corynebacterium pacaense TaxID=1816684 RepID=UPI0009B9C6E3|nr:YbjN domain-containing protein [Corynebacterium pacaense]